MSIGFTQLRTFHAVAEHRGFTAASKVLGIGQPTVTTQIKALEERYGVELFLRRGRRIELTDAGQALIDITRRIMRLREEAHELMSGQGRLRSGRLRLAAVGPFHATEMIAAFKRDYPSIEISVLLGNSDQTLTRLLDLEADVAVLAHVVEDPRVETVVYRTHEVVVFVNSDHPWFGRESIRGRELEGQPFVFRETGSTTRLAFARAIAEAGIAIRPVLEIGSREGVWKAVERGLGIGVVADFEFVEHPRLRTVKLADMRIRTEYRIAWLQDRSTSPTIRAFTKVIEAMTSAQPGRKPGREA